MEGSGLDELTRGLFGFTQTVIAVSFMDEPEVSNKMVDHFKEVLEKNGVEILRLYYGDGLGWAQFTVTNLTEIEVYNLFPLLTEPNNRMNSVVSRAVILLKSGSFKTRNTNRTVFPQDLTLFWCDDSRFYRIK